MNRKNALPFRGALFGMALSACAGAAAAQTYQVEVIQSPVTGLSQSDAQSIIGEVNRILASAGSASNDCSGMRFELAGIRTATIPDSVDSESQLNELLAQRNNRLAVVEFLNFCGGFNVAVAGCAGRNTTAVAENQGAATEQQRRRSAGIWLHEFAHSQGLMKSLTPAAAHSPTRGALMFPAVSTRNVAINDAECSIVALASNSAYRPVPPSAILVAAESEELYTPSYMDLELVELLEGVWDGVPFAEIDRHADQVDSVRLLLLDARAVDLWPNAVIALGRLGTEADIAFLIWYYEFLGSREFSKPVEQAQINVPLAVGFLGDRLQTNRGSNFLSSLLQPEAVVEETARSDEGAELSARQISQNALIGIEISPDRRSLNDRTQDGGSRLSPLELESITATEEFSPDLLSHIQELGTAARNLGVEQVFGPN